MMTLLLYDCPDMIMMVQPKAHIPLESAFASANFRVAKAENDAQTT